MSGLCNLPIIDCDERKHAADLDAHLLEHERAAAADFFGLEVLQLGYTQPLGGDGKGDAKRHNSMVCLHVHVGRVLSCIFTWLH